MPGGYSYSYWRVLAHVLWHVHHITSTCSAIPMAITIVMPLEGKFIQIIIALANWIANLFRIGDCSFAVSNLTAIPFAILHASLPAI